MMYQVVNPATGKIESEYPTATDAEVSDVLARAGRGYTSWRRTAIEERAGILRRVAELYRDRAGELAAIITREMGKVTKAAKGELRFVAAIYEYYADNGADLLKDQPLVSNLPGTAWVRKTSIGALLGIMPWNYPYYQVARFAAPNLMIGNTIVLKHAPQCPESALAMEQLFRDAGLPGRRLYQHLRQQRAGRRPCSQTLASPGCRSPAASEPGRPWPLWQGRT